MNNQSASGTAATLEEAVAKLSSESAEIRAEGVVAIARLVQQRVAAKLGVRLQEIASSDPSGVVRCHAIEALLVSHEAIDHYLPTLIDYLQNGIDDELRITALNTLSRIGSAARVAVPHLFNILEMPIDSQTGPTRVQQCALEALWLIDPSPREAVQAFVIAARWDYDCELDLRYGELAANKLELMGRKIVLELLRVACDEKIIGTYFIRQILERIRYFPPEADDLVLAGLASKQLDFWHGATPFLWFDDPIPVVRKALKHPVQRICELALRNIRKSPDRFAETLPDVIVSATATDDRLDNEEERNTRWIDRICDHLLTASSIAGKDPMLREKVVSFALQFARCDDPWMQLALFENRRIFNSQERESFLQTLRKHAHASLQTLIDADLLAKDEGQERFDARQCSNIITSLVLLFDEKDSKPYFMATKSGDYGRYFFKNMVLELLQSIGPRAAGTVPFLEQLIRSTDESKPIWRELVRTLAAIAPENALLQQVVHKDAQLRAYVAWKCIRLEVDSKRRIDHFCEMANDSNWGVRTEAVQTLWFETKNVKLVVPLLLSHLEDPKYAGFNYTYECKEDDTWGDLDPRFLRSQWPHVVEQLLQIAAEDASAIPLIALAIERQQAFHLNLMRVKALLFCNSKQMVPELMHQLLSQVSLFSSIEIPDLLCALEDSGEHLAIDDLRYLLQRVPPAEIEWHDAIFYLIRRAGVRARSLLVDLFQLAERIPEDSKVRDHESIAKTMAAITPGLQSHANTITLILDNSYLAKELFAIVRWQEPDVVERVLVAEVQRHVPNIESEVIAQPNKTEPSKPVAFKKQIDPQDLVKELQDSRPEHRRGAIIGLGYFGTRAESVVTALFPFLDEDSVDLRDQTLIALERIGSLAIVPALCKRLEVSNWAHRLEAAELLSRLGNDESVPGVMSLLSDFDIQNAKLFEQSLAAATHDRLVRQIREVVEGDGKWALSKLGSLRGHLPLLLPLAGIIESGNSVLRETAILVLRRFEKHAVMLVPLVRKMLVSEEWTTRLAAGGTICAIAPSNDVIRECLSDLSKDPNEIVSESAIIELEHLEPDE